MAWLSWKTGAGGTVVEERVLSFLLGEYYPDETMQIVPDERLFLETDDSLLDIEDILCQAARVRGVEVEALCEVIRRNIQNVFFKT